MVKMTPDLTDLNRKAMVKKKDSKEVKFFATSLFVNCLQSKSKKKKKCPVAFSQKKIFALEA